MKGFGRVCPRGVRVGGESVSDCLRHERNQRTRCLSRGGLAGVKKCGGVQIQRFAMELFH